VGRPQIDAALRAMLAELVRRAERVDVVTLLVKRIRTCAADHPLLSHVAEAADRPAWQCRCARTMCARIGWP
jgi:hypothetical protein